MVWRSTIPTTATNIMDMAIYFPQNWAIIDSILGEEHYSFSSVLSGRHMPGTAVLCSDATTGITGMIPPGSGALAFDETLGSLAAYLNSSWMWVAEFPTTYVSAYLSGGDQSVPSSGATVTFNAKVQDDLDEFDTTTYTFTAAASGFFLIKATISVVTAGGIDVTLAIIQADLNEQIKNIIDTSYTISTYNSLSVTNHAIVNAEAGDKFKIRVTHTRLTDIVIESGSDRSVLIIKRLS